jgi:AcrR family transcriptional regulator
MHEQSCKSNLKGQSPMSLDTSTPEAAERKPDPRIRRTRLHVIQTARAMLNEHSEALTFTSVADRAFVARQTLYKHWGTVENLIAETIEVDRVGSEADYDGLDVPARISLFLSRLISEIDPGTAAAIASLIAASSYEPDSRKAMNKLSNSLFELFQTSVGQVTPDQFVQLVAPVIFLTIAGAPVSDELVASLAERGAQLID